MNNAAWRERAERLLPGGVDSPVRAFAAVGGAPPVMASAQGAHLRDEDGRDYIDYVLAYGPHLLGHRPTAVVEAIAAQLQRGVAYGATSALEVELAERVSRCFPSLEMLRFVNSGTEATMSALRLARGATGRDVIVKCAGAYHGHADALLAEAGSGVATLGVPGSRGVPAAAVADTVVVPYNDTAAMQSALHQHDVAAVIVEPVAGNMGCVPPAEGWLESLRAQTRAHGALLIFDEVMTGFRVARGGAQQLYGVTPDLTCLGKVLGGGLPVAAYGGRRDLMEQMAPAGPVYQAGTLSGNPLAMAAGCAILDALDDSVYARLEALGARLAAGLVEAAQRADVALVVNRVGSMLTPFFTDRAVTDYPAARHSDTAAFAAVHRALIAGGIFWPPSQFEAAFLSTAHSDADIDRTIEVFVAALTAMGG